MLATIERLALDPTVSVEKMDHILQMQERILDRRAQKRRLVRHTCLPGHAPDSGRRDAGGKDRLGQHFHRRCQSFGLGLILDGLERLLGQE